MKDKKNAVIFDLDGTLWEVTDATYKSANEITKKYNLKHIDINTVRGVFGLNRVECAEKYFPYLDIEESVKYLDEMSELNIENLKKNGGNLYPNLEKALQELILNYKLFIVSNTGHSEYIKAFLTSSKLDKYFVDYIAASKLNISKAEGINKIINDYKIEKSVYVGDTKKDLEASQNANVPFIQAKYGFGEDLKTKYSIDSIEELPGMITKLF